MKKVLSIFLFLSFLSTLALADPVLSETSPPSSFAGQDVIIYGQGFSSTGNTIFFTDQSQGMIYRTKIIADSNDSTSLKFKVPFYVEPLCSEENPPCPAVSKQVISGVYYIHVADAEGRESNSLSYEILIPCSCRREVSGTVTDQQDKPVEGISIYELENLMAVTDENGKYSFLTRGTANASHCPLGDTYIFVRKDEELLGQRFVPVTCGNYNYDFKVKILTKPSQILGDVNGDGSLTIVDALLITQYYIGMSVDIDEEFADVNCDNIINIIDALLVAQAYVGILQSLEC